MLKIASRDSESSSPFGSPHGGTVIRGHRSLSAPSPVATHRTRLVARIGRIGWISRKRSTSC
jgi:hypothetical protein